MAKCRDCGSGQSVDTVAKCEQCGKTNIMRDAELATITGTLTQAQQALLFNEVALKDPEQ